MTSDREGGRSRTDDGVAGVAGEGGEVVHIGGGTAGDDEVVGVDVAEEDALLEELGELLAEVGAAGALAVSQIAGMKIKVVGEALLELGVGDAVLGEGEGDDAVGVGAVVGVALVLSQFVAEVGDGDGGTLGTTS